MQEAQPQIYSVKAVTVPTITPVVFSCVTPMNLFDQLRPSPNPNRGRLSGSAGSSTFAAQTGRGSDQSCVINGSTDPKYARLMDIVHALAQNVDGAALPCLGFQILKLERGQNLNRHRDYQNHPDYRKHTMKFGKYQGGSLQCCEPVCGILMTRTISGCRSMLCRWYTLKYIVYSRQASADNYR